MLRASVIVRQALFAALLLGPFVARAEIVALFDLDDGSVVVSGLEPSDRRFVEGDPGLVRLQLAETPGRPGMLIAVMVDGDVVRVSPRFPLRAGEVYHLSLALPGKLPFETTVGWETEPDPVPVLEGFAPAQSLIPANTLRFYLGFSEAMATNQARDAIRLERDDGSEVESPFLNLGTELWDPAQRRLTVLLDPGRVKLGVGPNLHAGAPLVEGVRYRLIVSGSMESATGIALGEDRVISFAVVAPERRPIDPAAWGLSLPKAGTSDPVELTFDRPMGSGASQRLIHILDHSGTSLPGAVETDGATWTFTPKDHWRSGGFSLVIDSAIEDVAGNTIRTPFDARSGTISIPPKPFHLGFRID